MMRQFRRTMGVTTASVATLLMVGSLAALDHEYDPALARDSDLVRFRHDGTVQYLDGTIQHVSEYTGRTPPVLFTDPATGQPLTSQAQTQSTRRNADLGQIDRISEGLTIPGLSINPTGSSLSIVQLNGPRYSPDGRYIVFESRANFVDEDTNNLPDIYRLDTQTNEIILVTKTFGLTGVPDNSVGFNSNPSFRVGAFSPAISEDGKKIAFYSALILTDVHNDYVWPNWRVVGGAVVPGAPANAAEEARASDEVLAYWVELDDDGDVIDMQLVTQPGEALPDFSPGSPYIYSLDITSDGQGVAFVSANGNLIASPVAPNPDITIDDDDLVWVWDRGTNEARLITRNGVLGPGAYLRMFHLPSYGPVRIGGNGSFVTFNSTLTGNQNITGFFGTSAQMEILGANISDPANPGPCLRVSIPNGFPVNTTNNLVANSGILAQTGAAPTGGTGRNEGASPHPTNPNLVAFFSNNSGGDSVTAGFGSPSVANGGTGLNTYGLYVKNIATGELTIPVRNESADGGAATWNFGTLGGGGVSASIATWSKDGNWLGFTADWDILTDGINPPPGLGFTDGFIPYAVQYPVVGPPVIKALTADGQATFAPGISGDKVALELGGTGDEAVFIVNDGVTFPGTSTLFPVIALYDGTQPDGDKLSRLDFGPALAPDTNDLSARPVVSEDGSVFAFVSFAANIVTDDTNGFPDVFVYDANSDAYTLISRNTSTSEVGNSASGAHRDLNNIIHQYAQSGNARQWNAISPIDITPDGRYVVFPSHSSNLGAVGVGRTNVEVQAAITDDPPNLGFNSQIYRYDRQTNEMLLVSDSFQDADGNSGYFLADDISLAPSISADGRYVVFQTRATNLGGFYLDPTLAGELNIYMRDLTLEVDEPGAITLISDLRDSSGLRTDFIAEVENIHPRISADGNRVVWSSRDPILEADGADDDPDNDVWDYDIYAWERDTDEIRLVSNLNGGFIDNSASTVLLGSDRFGMSRNGDYVVFQSSAPLTNADPDVPPFFFRDMYVWDAATGNVEYLLLGQDLDGSRWSGVQNWPAISDDGQYVVFWNQGRYTPIKTNNLYSLYVLNRNTGNITLLSQNANGQNADNDNFSFQDTIGPQFSWPGIANLPDDEDALGVVFDLQASNLVADDENGHRDVFYREFGFGTVVVIPGDIDGDGVVNVQDVTFLANVVSGLAVLPPGVNGDINGDEVVDFDDVSALANQIVN